MKKRLLENGKRGGKRANAGRKLADPGGSPAVRVSVSMPAALSTRLDSAAEQTGQSRSAIVVAGLRQILSQTPDRLREQIGG
jgi:hypothetical protein